MESKINRPTINIIANSIMGTMSGGDRIWIECSKRWSLNGFKINIFGSEESSERGKKYNLINVDYFNWPSGNFKKYGFLLNYLFRTVQGIFKLKSFTQNIDSCIIYSTSDFWPDSIPAFLMKIKNRKVKWIAGFFLFAPSPLQKNSPYKGIKWIIGFLYWLSQLPIYWIVKKNADLIFITSKPDVKKFLTKSRDINKIIVVKGGVDLTDSEEYLNSNNKIPIENRKYDACFVGRFHYQKGVLELIEIWKNVIEWNKNAKLVMIGVGPLENELKEKIKKFKLYNNIELVGFKDGKEKYEFFKQSKIIIHPAIYDSGGMAAAEAMAWGLPGVSFDLEALKTYYPKGMLKVPCYDLKKFATVVISLLEDKKLYIKVSGEAIKLVKKWDWDKRADVILRKIKTIL